MESSLKQNKPLCPYFVDCGGCDYQNIAYDDQLALKQELVQKIFSRFADAVVHPIIASPKEYHYRNRVTLHHDGKAIGLYARKTHDIIAIDRCVIATDLVNEKINQALQNKTSFLSGPNSVEIREDEQSHFVQVNAWQNQRLQKVVLEMAALNKTDHVLELYGGAGNLTFELIKNAPHLTMVEGDEVACVVARQSKKQAKSKKLKIICGDVLHHVFELVQALERFDVIIADPPRVGLEKSAVLLPRLKPKRIILVACEPHALAKDAFALKNAGYDLKALQPLDMFPQTRHLEIVAQFEKR